MGILPFTWRPISMTSADRRMMTRALTLARRGLGKTTPNPMVGCVIVNQGEVVGEGWHRRAGTPHAEVHALRQAGERAHGSDLFVTLEPCSHHGRTPPCADALIAAGVKRVVVAMVDPNPKVCGAGIERLRRAGVTVEIGLLEEASRQLNAPFITHMTTGRPFVIYKGALTLDGKIATASGDSRWVTGEEARREVHRLRAQVDAVMVGVGTVLADDPELTVRHGVRGKNPLRVVVDSTLKTPLTARLITSGVDRTMIATVSRDRHRASLFEQAGVKLLPCRDRDGRVDLEDLLERLGRLGIQSLLLEAGGELASQALRLGVIGKFLFFLAPKLVGGDGPGPFAGQGVLQMNEALRLKDVRMRRCGTDFMVEGYPEQPCLPA
jgi:diaminohydroxyphosphoribosylaminopyrimidine deaminase/5-amino-6-(5-phosphoribosylamino)uracil reductase